MIQSKVNASKNAMPLFMSFAFFLCGFAVFGKVLQHDCKLKFPNVCCESF